MADPKLLAEELLRYGKDAFQAANNNAAENISAPIDGIAWALRKARIPVGEMPVGGSKWMEHHGLTKPVETSPASVAGETAMMFAPFGIYKKFYKP